MIDRSLLLPVLMVLAACSPNTETAESTLVPDMGLVAPVEVFLPEGDATDGRQAFLDLRCEVCHSVAGEAGQDMPEPFAANPGPELGVALASLSRDEIADSIIVPSHVVDESAAQYTDGVVSPMGDYTHATTIRRLIDIVAFLQSL